MLISLRRSRTVGLHLRMGCGGSKPLGTPGTTTDIAEGTPGTTTDIGKDTTTTNTTTTTSSDNIPEGIPVDYELDGEEMDMVELALFIAKTKRDGVWIRSVNAVNLDGERDKFIAALGKCRNIENLDLSENDLDAGMQMFVPVLGKMPRLQKLMLANNGLQAAGVEALTTTVNSLEHLTKLDLGYNDLGSKGAAALAKLLAGQSAALSSLVLDGNFFGCDDGTNALVAEIAKLQQLQLLSVRGNSIKGETAILLAAALETLTNVTTLNISENNFGVKGTKAFIAAVAKMTSLKELVANNALDEDLLDELKKAVPSGCEVEAW